MRKIAASLLLGVALVESPEAQELTAALSLFGPFATDDVGGKMPGAAELRFTLPLSDRVALEPLVSAGWRPDGRSPGVEGFYGAQVRQRILRLTGKSAYGFATYGVAGYSTKSAILPPVIGLFGFGLHQRVSNQLAFRPELQLVTFHIVPIGARVSVGLSVNVGQ